MSRSPRSPQRYLIGYPNPTPVMGFRIKAFNKALISIKRPCIDNVILKGLQVRQGSVLVLGHFFGKGVDVTRAKANKTTPILRGTINRCTCFGGLSLNSLFLRQYPLPLKKPKIYPAYHRILEFKAEKDLSIPKRPTWRRFYHSIRPRPIWPIE